jgi:hypothetical protein
MSRFHRLRLEFFFLRAAVFCFASTRLANIIWHRFTANPVRLTDTDVSGFTFQDFSLIAPIPFRFRRLIVSRDGRFPVFAERAAEAGRPDCEEQP